MNKEKSIFIIDEPKPCQIPELRALWKEAFGDTDDFLDTFESTAFSFQRCRCVTIDQEVAAALYWFNCEFMEKPIAYIYAVATSKKYRGQGLCHALMENTHYHLKEKGYEGALLSPASETLFAFYESMGYQTCVYTETLSFEENTLYTFEKKAIDVRPIEKYEFSRLRRNFLSETAVLQENENLDFLETQADFYAGKNFLLTAHKKRNFLLGIEFLGDTSVIPSILAALECTSGTFYTPGGDQPVGMYYSFTDGSLMPSYFGFTFG